MIPSMKMNDVQHKQTSKVILYCLDPIVSDGAVIVQLLPPLSSTPF